MKKVMLQRINNLKLVGWRQFIEAFVNLAFPPACLHCNSGNPEGLLCKSCQTLLNLLETSDRCPLCFSTMSSAKTRQICIGCSKTPSVFNGVAAAFDYAGPAATLMRKLKYSDSPYLAEGMSAYLVAQLIQLKWPLPEVIVPVPITLTHLMQRGYNQSRLLADGVAKLLQCPIKEALTRKMGDFSQAGLNKKQRMQLKGNHFQLKKEQALQDKCILIIDDVMTTGSTLRHCATSLLTECPSHIYALTVCKALE